MNTFSRKNAIIQTYTFLVLDALCILVAYRLSCLLRFGIEYNTGGADTMVCLFLVILSAFLDLILDWNSNVFNRGYFGELASVTRTVAVLVVALSTMMFISQWGMFFSRLVVGFFAVTDVILTYITHILGKKYLLSIYKNSASSDKIIVVTTEKYVERIFEGIRSERGWSYEITGIILLDRITDTKEIDGIPVIAHGEDYKNVLQQQVMDAVFLFAPRLQEEERNTIIEMLELMGVACYYSLGSKINIQSIGTFAGHTVALYGNTYADYRRKFIKRVMDICGALVGILILTIFYPFVALAIKLDSKGPVVFKQERIGRNGRRFYIYKFRSMYIDAEERKAELMKHNEMDGLMFKMENDPRITKVGRFIRKTSIDELPQFVNVLKGDMSLVGTRPPTVGEFEQYSPYYRRRLSITPGITGMWQVSGRSDITDFDKVVELDLNYIDNWSIMLDIKILIQTVLVVLLGKGSK